MPKFASPLSFDSPAVRDASAAALGLPGTIIPLTYAATVEIAFVDQGARRSLVLTGNVTFTGTGYADGRQAKVFVAGDSVVRTLAFPSGWAFLGAKPTEIAASKRAVLSLECIGATEADVRCAWGVES